MKTEMKHNVLTKRDLYLSGSLLGAILTIVLLIGVITGDDDINLAEEFSEELLGVQSGLTSLHEQYATQYTELSNDYSSLQSGSQSEIGNLKASLAEAQKTTWGAQSELSTMKSQSQQQASEIGNLRASLQNAVNDRAAIEQRFLQSQQTVAELQRTMVAQQKDFSEIWAKVVELKDKEDPTVNDFTVDEIAIFYEIFNKWWTVVME